MKFNQKVYIVSKKGGDHFFKSLGKYHYEQYSADPLIFIGYYKKPFYKGDDLHQIWKKQDVSKSGDIFLNSDFYIKEEFELPNELFEV